ncbi:MAG: ribosomal-processing cysteine protease Prp [Tissierellia bacterium]|jgi:uncharacterized protein YsxB (DUF464 family)|nr:ribosomal-processing cysteine protease Prp [Tissierellia bacterium]
MIKVKIFKNEQEHIVRYNISGHANYSSHGEDIVCSAVSVLAYTALNALMHLSGLNENEINYTIDEPSGYLDVILPKIIEGKTLEKTEIILKTLEIGIKSVIESYPKYVTLEYREV